MGLPHFLQDSAPHLVPYVKEATYLMSSCQVVSQLSIQRLLDRIYLILKSLGRDDDMADVILVFHSVAVLGFR